MTPEQEQKLWTIVRQALLLVVSVVEEITGLRRKCKECGAKQ